MASKQLQLLLNASLAIEAEDAKEAGRLGFMARGLVQATMPHSNTGGSHHKRVNGNYSLTMTAGDPDVGLPYGSIPRLILSWLATEAVRKKERELILGDSMSGFMRELNLVPTGGRWGSITRLKDQSRRLFGCMISCSNVNPDGVATKNLLIADNSELWWHKTAPNQSGLFESTVTLSQGFFDEIIQNPVPVDMLALKALKRSPMAIDIYCWLTYRMSYLRRPTSIPWELLQAQFGCDYPDTAQGKAHFKQKFNQHLKSVLVVYPEAKLEASKDSLTLKPSKTHVKKIA